MNFKFLCHGRVQWGKRNSQYLCAHKPYNCIALSIRGYEYSKVQYPVNPPTTLKKNKEMLNMSGYGQNRAVGSKLRRHTLLVSNVIRSNWFITIAKSDYLVEGNGMQDKISLSLEKFQRCRPAARRFSPSA